MALGGDVEAGPPLWCTSPPQVQGGSKGERAALDGSPPQPRLHDLPPRKGTANHRGAVYPLPGLKSSPSLPSWILANRESGWAPFSPRSEQNGQLPVLPGRTSPGILDVEGAVETLFLVSISLKGPRGGDTCGQHRCSRNPDGQNPHSTGQASGHSPRPRWGAPCGSGSVSLRLRQPRYRVR